jgi:hypothetical protein
MAPGCRNWSDGFMDGAAGQIWFLGDLEDPWVTELLRSIPESTSASVLTVKCAEEIPERPFDPNHAPDVIVLHRARLSQPDVVQLERWRTGLRSSTAPRIILCYSPYVRYAELERADRAVDLAIPEATAAETLAWRLQRTTAEGDAVPRSAPPDALPVEVASSDHDLRIVLSEAIDAAGYSVTIGRDMEERGSVRVLTLWDVPVLESGWTARLRQRARLGPVIALLGFADRETVSQARAGGAAACLDVPFDLDSLIFVLDRVSRSARRERHAEDLPGRTEPAHVLPPSPVRRTGRMRSKPAVPDSR